MSTLSALAEAHPVLGLRWSQDPPPEERQLLALARDALSFPFTTGQRYHFEDFFKSVKSIGAGPPHVKTGSPDLRQLMEHAKRFFVDLLEQPESTQEREQLQSILDALHFIDATGQHDAFESYRTHVQAHAPPFAVASFATWQEAQAWLMAHPSPPDPANVLIADRYHDVFYDREMNIRRLPGNSDLAGYLSELQEQEPFRAVASFTTRQEAQRWLDAQPAPPPRAWVSIAGEPYLAAYHLNLEHRVLYPCSQYVQPADSSPSEE